MAKMQPGRERERKPRQNRADGEVGDGGTIGELTRAFGFRSTALGSTKEKAREIEEGVGNSPDPRAMRGKQ